MALVAIGVGLGVVVMALIHALRVPQDHERALLLSVLAFDAAAVTVEQHPDAHPKELRDRVVAILEATEPRITRNRLVLEHAATGALVRLGIRSLPFTPPGSVRGPRK